MVRFVPMIVTGLLLSITTGCWSRQEDNRQVRSTRDAQPARKTGERLVAVPVLIDFGRVARESENELTCWLENNGAEIVLVSAVKTSCECLMVQLERPRIEPGQKVKATVKLSLKNEPDFAGRLQATATGYAGQGASSKEAFELTIRADVPPK